MYKQVLYFKIVYKREKPLLQYHFDFMWESIHHLPHCHVPLLIASVDIILHHTLPS